jgi:hypothetical protein
MQLWFGVSSMYLATLIHLAVNDVLCLIGAGPGTECHENWQHLYATNA